MGRRTPDTKMSTDKKLKELARAILMLPVEMKFRAIQRMLIAEALEATDGNRSLAAEILGTTRRTVIRHFQLSQRKSPNPRGARRARRRSVPRTPLARAR